jgi:predicted MPP superfamily phosphohydrolase
MNDIRLFFYPAFFIIILFSCNSSKNNFKKEDRKNSLIIWAHSDIQARNISERKEYADAIKDVKKNIGLPDIGIIAGDLIQRHRDAENDFKWFFKLRKSIDIRYWYEISGNHDARSFANYFKYVKKPLYYTVVVGNLIIIFLSDEVDSSPSEISNAAFDWWKKWVTENQDKNIITITHASLKNSGLWFTGLERTIILNSKRFEDILSKFKVNLWLSGHTSVPLFMGYSSNYVKKFNNILFMNISSIRSDYLLNSSSRFIYVFKDKKMILIRRRDHKRKEFNDFEDIIVKLKHKFLYAAPIMVIPEGIVR